MEKEKLYRLLDILDEIKQLDELISKHAIHPKEGSSLMIDQYRERKNQLLTYFINEINASPEFKTSRLTLIKQVMERFYNETESKDKMLKDKGLSTLVNALSV